MTIQELEDQSSQPNPLPQQDYEELFRLLLEHSPAAIAVLDRQLRYLFFNQHWINQYQHLNHRLMIGQLHPEVFPEIPQSWQNVCQRSLAGLTQVGEAELALRANGSKDWIKWEVRPWHGGVILFLEPVPESHELTQVVQQLQTDLKHKVEEHNAQLEQMLRLEAILKRITDKVRDSLDENQILQSAVQELALGLNVGCCNAALYNLNQNASTICYEHAISMPGYQGRIANMAAYPEIYDQLVKGQYFQFCSLVPNPVRGRVVMLACPIFDNKGVLGDLWLVNSENYIFQESEIRLVQQVANQCAIAIRQARLYQATQAQVDELEKLNRLKDDFLSTVSHELRTPVSNMKMAIHLLKVAPSLERRDRYLEILQAECEREADLINDLLDLQRLEAASFVSSTDVICLKEWLPTIIAPFLVRAQNYHQNLQVDLALDLPLITTDCASLGRILAELLNNACKYTTAGGRIVLIVDYHEGRETEVVSEYLHVVCPPSLATRTAEQNVSKENGKFWPQEFCIEQPNFERSIEVCKAPDTDEPTAYFSFTLKNEAEISATELARIFEKFYRVPNADPWKQGGTGLGLALVQKLVEQLKGSLYVESHNGWTTFTVQLSCHSKTAQIPCL